MELKPTIGVDEIEFGMTQTEVSGLLGLPSSVFHEEDEPDHVVHQYDRLKLRLTFYNEEGGKLGYIRSADPDLKFKGAKVIGQPVGTAKDLVVGSGADAWEVDNYQFFDSHFHEGTWLILNVEYGEVTDVEIGVPFKNDEEYDWKR